VRASVGGNSVGNKKRRRRAARRLALLVVDRIATGQIPTGPDGLPDLDRVLDEVAPSPDSRQQILRRLENWAWVQRGEDGRLSVETGQKRQALLEASRGRCQACGSRITPATLVAVLDRTGTPRLALCKGCTSPAGKRVPEDDLEAAIAMLLGLRHPSSADRLAGRLKPLFPDLAWDAIRESEQEARTRFRNCQCPFCRHPVRYDECGPDGIGSCTGCSALYGSIPDHTGMVLAARLNEQLGLRGLYEALDRWDDLCVEDCWRDCYFVWFNTPALTGTSPSPFEQVEGPQFSDPTAAELEFELPVLVCEGEPVKPESVFLPTCKHCVHCLQVEDRRNPAFPLPEALPFCAYPVEPGLPDERESAILSLGCEEAGGYPMLDKIVRNVLVEWFLDALVQVDQEQERLTAFAPRHHRVQPICPRFKLDPRRLEYDVAEVVGNVRVRYNVIDLDAIRRKDEASKQEAMREQTIEKITGLRDRHPVLNRRIQMGKPFAKDRRKLIEVLEQNLSREELSSMSTGAWQRVLSISNRLASRLASRFGWSLAFSYVPEEPLDLSAVRLVRTTSEAAEPGASSGR